MAVIHRRVLLKGLLAGSLLAAGGCRAPWSRAEPTPAPPIEMSFITFDTEGAWGRAEEELIRQFQESYPTISFDRDAYGQPPQLYLTMAPPPDVMVMAAGFLLKQAIAEGQIMNVTDLWEQSGLVDRFPEAFQRLSEYNGKQYFVPIGYTWSAIYYNKEIFAQYGLEPPKTWNEFLAICDRLLTEGITPLSIGGQDSWLAMMWFDYLNLRLNGGDFHRDLVNGEISYEDPRVMAVLELWSSMFQQGYFIEEPQQMSDLESLTAIIRGDEGRLSGAKAAMTLTSPSWLDDLPLDFRKELDFFPLPIMDPSLPIGEILSTYGYMIPTDAKHRDQSLAFLNHAASTEAQTKMMQQLSAGPAGLAPANVQVDPDLFSAELRKGMALVQEADDVMPFYMFHIPTALWPSIDQGLRSFLREPDQVDAFAASLERARERAVKENLFLSGQ